MKQQDKRLLALALGSLCDQIDDVCMQAEKTVAQSRKLREGRRIEGEVSKKIIAYQIAQHTIARILRDNKPEGPMVVTYCQGD